MSTECIQLHQVKCHFPASKSIFGKVRSWVRAVDGVSLTIFKGECLGLVGESGCGKSTLGRCILKLVPVTSGSIHLNGQSIQDLDEAGLRQVRPKMQMVFQDPRASLNPRMKILAILREAIVISPGINQKSILQRSTELLEMVDLRPEHLYRYPHEFSGGQLQRICIARALATNPEFIVFDEATSALDVSVQAQIVNLMNRLQSQLDLTFLFISHDLSILEQVCHRIAVMYAGRIAEVQEARKLFLSPRHPYTKVLRDALPIADPNQRHELASLAGEVPSLTMPPAGCRFHPRCGHASHICQVNEPNMTIFDERNWVRCHHHEQLAESNQLAF